jgi:hypothetical protein
MQVGYHPYFSDVSVATRYVSGTQRPSFGPHASEPGARHEKSSHSRIRCAISNNRCRPLATDCRNDSESRANCDELA